MGKITLGIFLIVLIFGVTKSFPLEVDKEFDKDYDYLAQNVRKHLSVAWLLQQIESFSENGTKRYYIQHGRRF